MEGRPFPQDYIQPGPLIESLLTMQNVHRSTAVWTNQVAHDVLNCRRASDHTLFKPIQDGSMHSRVIHYLKASGFYGVARIGLIETDHALITALVERWRPETHTFHLTMGETNISLQDIEILTGLPINGQPVTGHLDYDWPELCHNLLGLDPPKEALDGNRLKMRWLANNFRTIPPNASELQIQCFTRAFILRIIGGLLFSDKSSSKVHLMFLPLLENLEEAGRYSWGSACLSWLYRELCRATNPIVSEISGATFILQLWAWARFPSIAPRIVNEISRNPDDPYGYRWQSRLTSSRSPMHVVSHYRRIFDTLSLDNIIWEPYTKFSRPQLEERIWTAVVPLICFHIIEWHQPDRCMRQFGMDQPIPVVPYQQDELHVIDLRGQSDNNWHIQHAPYIDAWNDRLSRLALAPPLGASLGPRSEYMQWYIQHTRRWISVHGAQLTASAEGIHDVYNIASSSNQELFRSLQQKARSILGALDEQHRLLHSQSPQPAPPAIEFPRIQMQQRSTRKRRRTMTSRRHQIDDSTRDDIIPIPPPVT